jgi:hypothetical protein
MVQRHALVPIIAGPGAKRSLPGVMAWDDASSLLARILQPAAEIRMNAPAQAEDELPGNAVTSSAGQRYDELDAQPLLTEQEMRALLGSPE